MDNKFKYSNTNKRYHTLDYYYKNKFNEKIFKVSLNANFSCPNIDGTVGYGGCIYCSKTGSGEFAGNKEDEIVKQFHEVKNMMLKKWPKAKYIGYFQARTNTHAPVETLRKLHDKILEQEGIVGLNIATRPDAISNECLDYLEELNKKTYLTIMAENIDIKKIQQSMPDYNAIGALSDFFKIMGDSTRLQIILSLQNGELCVSDIAATLDMNQSTVSHQLKILRNSRIVKYRRDAKVVYYSLDDEHVEDIISKAFAHIDHAKRK